MLAAREACMKADYKWCIIKSYYAMFHAAKALLFSLGFKERRHFAIAAVLEDLYKNGRLESKYIEQFASAMSSREDADYRYTYSHETAEIILDAAEEFAEMMRRMAKMR